MANVPTQEDFLVSLNALSERDKGTPELAELATSLEPSEDAVRAFIKQQMEIVIKKQKAVAESPIPRCLLTEPHYQEGLAWLSRKRTSLPSKDEWCNKRVDWLLQEYKPVTESYFRYRFPGDIEWDEANIGTHLTSYNSEVKRRSRFNRLAIDFTGSRRPQWDTTYINAIYKYSYDLSREKKSRSPYDNKDEKAAIELLRQYVAGAGMWLDNREAVSAALDDLHHCVTQLDDLYFPVFIQRNDETTPLRELTLSLWLWFRSNGQAKVTGASLRKLLDIDSIQQELLSEDAFKLMVTGWRKCINEKRVG